MFNYNAKNQNTKPYSTHTLRFYFFYRKLSTTFTKCLDLPHIFKEYEGEKTISLRTCFSFQLSSEIDVKLS